MLPTRKCLPRDIMMTGPMLYSCVEMKTVVQLHCNIYLSNTIMQIDEEIVSARHVCTAKERSAVWFYQVLCIHCTRYMWQIKYLNHWEGNLHGEKDNRSNKDFKWHVQYVILIKLSTLLGMLFQILVVVSPIKKIFYIHQLAKLIIYSI